VLLRCLTFSIARVLSCLHAEHARTCSTPTRIERHSTATGKQLIWSQALSNLLSFNCDIHPLENTVTNMHTNTHKRTHCNHRIHAHHPISYQKDISDRRRRGFVSENKKHRESGGSEKFTDKWRKLKISRLMRILCHHTYLCRCAHTLCVCLIPAHISCSYDTHTRRARTLDF